LVKGNFNFSVYIPLIIIQSNVNENCRARPDRTLAEHMSDHELNSIGEKHDCDRGHRVPREARVSKAGAERLHLIGPHWVVQTEC
jgi:hypothetical protein